MKYWSYETDQPVIDLEQISFGAIILRPTGVRYSNQTGGYACLHPQAEGVFVPLPASEQMLMQITRHFTGEKWHGHCYEGIDAETADFLNRVLRADQRLSFITVDRDRLADSHEAWVYVDLVEPEGDPESNIIAGFGSCKAILTWPNSD